MQQWRSVTVSLQSLFVMNLKKIVILFKIKIWKGFHFHIDTEKLNTSQMKR
jgi:hypothetical protein